MYNIHKSFPLHLHMVTIAHLLHHTKTTQETFPIMTLIKHEHWAFFTHLDLLHFDKGEILIFHRMNLHKPAQNTQNRNHGGSPPNLGFYEATHRVGETRSKPGFIQMFKMLEHHISTLNNPIPRYFTKIHHWNLEHSVKVCLQGGFPYHIISTINNFHALLGFHKSTRYHALSGLP